MLAADAYVLAMGSFSAGLARGAGVSLDIYPAKGYSATLPVLDAARRPRVSLTDDEYKLVFSRFGDRLRIAGTAELNGYDLALNPVRCEAIVRRALEVFPGMSRPELASYWAGLRPATPGNVPYIGRARVAGPLPEHRPRHARLDPRLRLGPGPGRPDLRAAGRRSTSLSAASKRPCAGRARGLGAAAAH